MNKRLLELRQFLKLSQKDFAAALNMSRSAISYIEQGQRTLTMRTLIDICNKFNVNRDWLQTGAGPMMMSNDKVRDELIDQLINDYAVDNNTLEEKLSLRTSIIKFLNMHKHQRYCIQCEIDDVMM